MDRYQSTYGRILSNAVTDSIFNDIWEYKYLIRVPYLSTMSEDYIKQFGVPTSGDKSVDREQMNQLTKIYASVDKMVSMFKDGTPIRIMEPDAPKRIYESVSRYLDYCRDMLEKQINIGDAPLEDLLAMDHFANSIYEHAKYHMVANTHSSALAQALSRFSGFKLKNERMSLLPSAHQNTDINRTMVGGASINDIPERESLADLFKEKMAGSLRTRTLLGG